ncbi:MAG: GDP-mannose 6-dehydrogenase [Ignavibacteriaceae bacterium]
MKISIFGLGYVGCVSLGCLAKNGNQVIGVDVNPTKVALINKGIATIVESGVDELISEAFRKSKISATSDAEQAVIESDLSIIAVGTPSTNEGHLNLEYIFQVAKDIAKAIKKKNKFHSVVIRSTVMPGTVKKVAEIIESLSGKKNNTDFGVGSNPEFLREGTAVKDYFHPPFTLIASESQTVINNLKEIYAPINAEIIIADVKIAEIIKYINNTFHALKVGFANEVGNICKAIGIDAKEVMNIFIRDTVLNISPYYLKPGFAYGGSCLPKDLKALQTMAHDLYLETPIINSINKSNDQQIKRAINLIQNFKKNKLGFVGISFKEGTDDLRNSPVVILIESLLGKGFEIAIFDSQVNYSKLTGRNKDFIDNHIPHLSNLMTDNLEKLVKYSEVIIVSNSDPEIKYILSSLDQNIIVDLSGSLNAADYRYYYGINW